MELATLLRKHDREENIFFTFRKCCRQRPEEPFSILTTEILSILYLSFLECDLGSQMSFRICSQVF